MNQEKNKSNQQNRFLAKVQEKLDSEPGMFVQAKFLCDIGIFGSHSSALQTVKSGEIPHVRVSPYRLLIEKSAVIDFIKEKFCERKE